MTDSYYAVPEDVKMSWAHLANDLKTAADGHGGHEMTFTVLIRGGIPREIISPEYRKREPRGSFQDANGRLWWAVVRRLQSVGRSHGRDCLLEIRIDLDAQENPVSWREPDVRYMDKAR